MTIIFRPRFRHSGTGKVMDASKYNLKAWPIRLKDKKEKVKKK